MRTFLQSSIYCRASLRITSSTNIPYWFKLDVVFLSRCNFVFAASTWEIAMFMPRATREAGNLVRVFVHLGLCGVNSVRRILKATVRFAASARIVGDRIVTTELHAVFGIAFSVWQIGSGEPKKKKSQIMTMKPLVPDPADRSKRGRVQRRTDTARRR